MKKFLLLLCTLLASVGVGNLWATEYTVTYSPSTGSYTATNAAGTWASAWKSTATDPFVTLTTSANNIQVSSGNIYSGGSGCTYTLTASEGYLITGYTISGTAQTAAQTLTPARGGSATEFSTSGTTTLTVSGITTSKTSFTHSTPNNGIAISSFTISLMSIPSVTSTSGLSNNKCYNIINNRGWWAVGNGATDINSTAELNLATSLSDTKQQFAFIYYDDATDDSNDGYYLYSVSEGKFAYKNGSKLSLTPFANGGAAPSKVTFTASTNDTYKATAPVVVTVAGDMFGVSTGKSPDVFAYNYANDGGNASTIYETGSFDATAALAAIQDYFHPTHTITYIVKDSEDNTLFNSGAIDAPLGTYTLPSEYQRNYFYTYSAAETTITGESAANTDMVVIATPKSTAFQYTANTTSPIYYNLNIRSKYLAYNDDASGDVELLTSSTPFNPDAAWAFIGNPYDGFKVINQTNGTTNYLTYTSVVTGSNYNNNNISFVADGDFTNQLWYVEANTGGFCLRMKENTNIYFHHDSGKNYLRTCSVNEWGSVHNDAGSTLTFASDEDVLANLYQDLQYVFFGEGIGLHTWGGSGTADDARANINSAGLALDAHATASYKTLYDALLNIKENISLNIPTEGYYRLKNKATGKYLNATALSGYTNTNKYVFANGNNTSAATVIRLYDKNSDGKLYMYNQGYGFGWVDAGKVAGSAGLGYLTTNPDKYVNWLPGLASGQIGFAICYGNGTGSYASYLMTGIYTADTEDDTVIAGTNYATNAAQWVVEPATSFDYSISEAGYATLCVPFAVEIPDGVTAYTVVVNKSDNSLTLTALEDIIPADTAVVLEGAKGSYTFEITTGGTCEEGNDLVGTYFEINAPNESYILQEQASGVGFYQVNTAVATPKVPANRAFLDVPASGVKAYFFNKTDVIKDVFKGVAAGEIYDLSGAKVAKMQRGKAYIVNGTTVTVK